MVSWRLGSNWCKNFHTRKKGRGSRSENYIYLDNNVYSDVHTNRSMVCIYQKLSYPQLRQHGYMRSTQLLSRPARPCTPIRGIERPCPHNHRATVTSQTARICIPESRSWSCGSSFCKPDPSRRLWPNRIRRQWRKRKTTMFAVSTVETEGNDQPQ